MRATEKSILTVLPCTMEMKFPTETCLLQFQRTINIIRLGDTHVCVQASVCMGVCVCGCMYNYVHACVGQDNIRCHSSAAVHFLHFFLSRDFPWPGMHTVG